MMKKNLFSMATLGMTVAAVFSFTACSEDSTGDSTGSNPSVSIVDGVAQSAGILFNDGTQIGNGDQNFVFTGKQTIKKGTYTLKGWVYVAKGAELTIEPGTIIKGDKASKAALIVEPGGKAIMEGTASAPIVMTSAQPAGSRKPGDWGGLIVCGNAKNNQKEMQIEGGPRTKHGGNDDADNSGIYRYIRIEFAGAPFQEDQEINGFTFGSVGNATAVDHIQVSYSNDDSYEWFGGTVNAKYLIAYKGWDDDFDTDNGFSGTVQFGLSVRDPRIADQSQSNGFESDNCADGAEVAPYTSALFSNITFVGPATDKNVSEGFQNTSSYINGGGLYPNNNSKLGLFQAAMQIRRSSRLNCVNSVAVGFPIGLLLDGEKGNTIESSKNGILKLQNLIFAGMTALGTDNNKKYEDQYYDKATGKYDANRVSYSHEFFLAQPGNQVMTESQLALSDPANVGQNYCPTSTSPLLNKASFEGLTNLFLNKVSYIGAFGGSTDNWMSGWTNFDPQNTVY